MNDTLHSFLMTEKNRKLVVDRIKESIDFSKLINGHHIKSLDIIYYDSSAKSFSNIDNSFELVARMGLSNMHYFNLSLEKGIINIGFSSSDFEKAYEVLKDIEISLMRNDKIENLLGK
jgi:hypothetical protein